MEKKKLIIDTDVGSDFDDAFAMLLACQSEEIDLLGVTTVWVDAYKRARIAKKVLKIAGKPEIPVFAGISKPLDGSGTVWYGYEGGGIMDEGDDTDPSLEPEDGHAVDFIIDTVMAHPGEVTIITLGSLSNLAIAIVKEPRIVKNIKEVIAMGGVIVPVVDQKGITRSPIEEYNFNCDKIATKIVFDAGLNFTIIPIDVTLKVPVPPEDVEILKNSSKPIARAAYRMLEVWPEQEKMLYISGGVPTEHTDLWMHDPLCVAVLADRSFVDLYDLHIAVEFGPTFIPRELMVRDDILRTVPKKLPPNCHVALGVRSKAFTDFVVERFCK
ncbi:nucleoside hydrolase [Diplocloster agilis]|uniref:nucleoside hydrolase n=1 Tax=Diplocloster agilis TaxID=2850323 RepID=UPI0008207E34|nr:nucleoside hydrolase [Suonthocola fibrivorans]MCU6735697.1 nucleoside hydrolase [Suonthocola fibrivorans]SCJ79987.1 Pyrimidine-specific ribonucleoside hydrolase rihB [uncultured Clostridium sp.]